jgi:hypothetical protein
MLATNDLSDDDFPRLRPRQHFVEKRVESDKLARLLVVGGAPADRATP